MNSIAHIINPFIADKNSDLFTAQPITFESMRKAKEKANGLIIVELLSAQYIEDKDIIPPYFKQTENLTCSVIDNQHFNKKIKLPFVYDILEKAYTESDAEYIVYTNVDIGLYEDFYVRVNEFINKGYDSFIINRRRLETRYIEINDLEKIQKDIGKSHPGFDCFVFHRSLFPKLKLDGICIGVPFVEITFSQNLFALGNNFKLFDKEYLTFHIGEEIFKKRTPKEYFKYNQTCFWKIAPQLIDNMDVKKIPYYHPFILWRLIKWSLHPCFPIRLMLKLESKKILQLF